MQRVSAHLHLPRLKRNDANVISVKPKLGPVYYLPELALVDVDFKVNENGRQRVLAKCQREVHAWVVGTPVLELGHGYWRQARYNPYEGPHFIDVDNGLPVFTAKYVWMHGKDVYFVH